MKSAYRTNQNGSVKSLVSPFIVFENALPLAAPVHHMIPGVRIFLRGLTVPLFIIIEKMSQKQT